VSARPTAALLLAALVACAAPGRVSAQSKADAFEGKVPPISGQLYRKTGRTELTLSGDFSLNDAFYTKYFLGLKGDYHFSEAWAAGLGAQGGVAVQTSSAVVCSSTAGCSSANEIQMRQVPGKIRWILGAQAEWSPIYGKLDALSESVAHFDLSLIAGPDLVAHDEVLSTAEAQVKAPGTVTAFGGHVGLGMRFFVTERWAVRLEFKDYLYPVNVPNGGIGTHVLNQFFLDVGASMFVPGANRATVSR
jgi:outer membrane beta-barrel protein